ncbi:hypothetical protein ACHAWF_004097, partial [Thalassiosira exigua]
PLEDAIRSKLVPALLDVEASKVEGDFCALLAHGVKMGGLNLRNPVAGAKGLHHSSRGASSVLVKSLREGGELDSVEHKQRVRAARTMARNERGLEEEARVARILEGSPRDIKKRLERIGETGGWLTVMPHKLHGTILSAEEWRDNAQLRYGIRPSGLCDRCDGCGAGFSVEHGLSCKKGGLVGLRHDVVRDEAGELAAMGLNHLRVTYEPYIFHGKGVVAVQGS